MTRADNAITSYAYDTLGRVKTLSASGQTETFTYDTCLNDLREGEKGVYLLIVQLTRLR